MKPLKIRNIEELEELVKNLQPVQKRILDEMNEHFRKRFEELEKINPSKDVPVYNTKEEGDNWLEEVDLGDFDPNT